MCNLYRMLASREAIRQAARVMVDLTDNIEPRPGGIYPNQWAPIVRNRPEGRELALARWGMPTPEAHLAGKRVDKGVTNIRNLFAWQQFLEPEHRCLVPVTAFAEPETLPGGAKGTAWFALGADQPLAFFAGIHVRGWRSVRSLAEGEVENDLFAFLTCAPNADVAPIHPKAMPVMKLTPEQGDEWMTAPARGLKRLQSPLPDGSLIVVERQGPRGKAAAEGAAPA